MKSKILYLILCMVITIATTSCDAESGRLTANQSLVKDEMHKMFMENYIDIKNNSKSIKFKVSSSEFERILKDLSLKTNQDLSSTELIATWDYFKELKLDVINKPSFDSQENLKVFNLMVDSVKKGISGALKIIALFNVEEVFISVDVVNEKKQGGDITVFTRQFNSPDLFETIEVKNNLIKKIELYQNKKLVKISNPKFMVKNNKYLFKSIDIQFFTHPVLVSMEVGYGKINDIFFPTTIKNIVKTENSIFHDTYTIKVLSVEK